MMQTNGLNKNVVLMVMICFFTNMGGYMILPLFPLFIEQMKFSVFAMSVIFAIFYVGKVCGGVPTGILLRKSGGKSVGVTLLAMLVISMIGFAWTTNFWLLCVLRFIQGVIATGLTVFVRSTINEWSAEDNRGTYNGYISSSDGAGMVLGPVISGWMSIYFPLNVPFYFVAICSGLALLALIKINNNHFEQRSKETVIKEKDRKIKINEKLAFYSTVHFLEMSAFAVFLTYFALYATHVMGWSSFSTSAAFTVVGVSTFISAPFVGMISDRLQDRLMICMIGLSLIAVEVIMFLAFDQHWIVYIGMLMGGIGGACYLDSFFAHIADTVHPEQRSSFIGNVVSFSELGAIVSPIIAGMLVSSFSLYVAFYFNLAILFAAILIQFVMRYKLKKVEYTKPV
ncbi:MFS transporter [Paenibacillus glacialis]|uniref:Permease n=1 Tax=Paenibacillus glacialis TaxID=494026 RepID=A0A162LTU4_9BACL|nr:MFS transporter [Paenibacillus glacialis]OAB43779.1 permease [Paenibacillus glacialis]